MRRNKKGVCVVRDCPYMTDRYSGYVVILESDIREDDAESTINAIKMIKGVISIQPIISDITIQMAKERAIIELVNKIIPLLSGE